MDRDIQALLGVADEGDDFVPDGVGSLLPHDQGFKGQALGSLHPDNLL